MARIEKLPQHIADLIAAGEVVERPGSAVKELIENSIDAGAKNITVEIKNGGMSYIRVTDDGCGMSPEDAKTAFLRHATSKLRDERGLEAIGTLGFRGEALAAVAAVSRIELLTREHDSIEGTHVSLDAGAVTNYSPAGCPAGTAIVVKDLFFNTPARLKFMKNDRAEGQNVSAAVLRCALSHPEVSVRYIKDGGEEYHSPGDGRKDSCVYSLLGREFAKGMLRAGSKDDGTAVSGFTSVPAQARGSRSHQFFFVNGRYVKSRILQAALEQAYKNYIVAGRFPGCVLYLDIHAAAVDVNVHPTKTEVKFLQEKAVFDTVYYAVRGALSSGSETAEIELSPRTAAAVHAAGPPKAEKPEKERAADKPAEQYILEMPGFVTSVPPAYSEAEETRAFNNEDIVPYRVGSIPERSMNEASGTADAESAPAGVTGWRIVGEVLKTYIVVEYDDGIFLIDKHAAHERMIFDRLKSKGYKPMTQALLEPLIAETGSEAAAALAENAEILSQLGFEADDFGGGAVIVRQAPADLALADIPVLLDEIGAAIASGRLGKRPGESLDKILYSVACKAAIKAGRRSDPAELEALVGRVMSGEIRYCPHGRPVAMQMTKTQIDRNFRRI